MILKRTSLIFFILFALAMTGCGGSGGGDTPPGETTYTIGGTVSGLSGTVVLRNNGADDLVVAQNGVFTFADAVADGSAYAVTVTTQPAGQTCTVENGAGTVSGADVTTVSVTCRISGGTPDEAFGTGGKVITAIGSGYEGANAMAIQPDGKIIAAGYSWTTKNNFALARYNADGSLDTTFDGDGLVTTAVGTGYDQAQAAAVQSDGKIVVAGRSHNGTNYDFALVRYNTDGSLDATFDGDGIVITDMGSADYGRGVALQSDGKIVVAGDSNGDFAVVRYNPDGSPDTTFDGDGLAITDMGAGAASVFAVALQSDGKILLAGDSSDLALVRYNPDGSLDTSFDSDGIALVDIGSSESAYSLAMQPDGKIVAAGGSNNGTNNDFALARFNTDGSLDTTFDTDGKATTDIGMDNEDAYAVALQPDGKIIAAGYVQNGASYEVAVVRYNANGSLDTTFDGDGIVTAVIASGGNDCANAAAVQADGKIVIAGYSSNGTDGDFFLARYWQ